jgi:hypothetical protein
MPRNPDYQCPRCGYCTRQKNDIRRHFFKRKLCPALKHDVEMTNEIKEYVLANFAYKVDKEGLKKQIQSLKSENALLRTRKTEDAYQMVLEQYLKGTHKRLVCGVTDITTDSLHAEVKCWSDWKHAFGQLMAYNLADPREELHVYLFGARPNKKQTEQAVNMFQAMKIIPHEVHIPSPECCNIINLITKHVSTLHLEDGKLTTCASQHSPEC